MGLMTVLKKMKQKEKEMRILILYPFKIYNVVIVTGLIKWTDGIVIFDRLTNIC